MEIDNRTSESEINSKKGSSFGHRFKQERVSQGLTLDDVAAELFILRRHLEAIEAEDFSKLPQLAFARGFVINYAKFLKLDPQQMSESFSRAYPEALQKKSKQAVESPLRPMGTLQRQGPRSWRVNPMLIIGVIAVIGLAVFLLRLVSNAQDNTNDDRETTTVVGELSDSEQSAGAALNEAPIRPVNSNTNSNDSTSGADSELNNTGSAIDLADNNE